MPGEKKTEGYSLKTIIIAYTATLLIVAVGASAYFGADRFSEYLSRQLQVQTQDAATALGIALSNMPDRDEAGGTLMDAMFESGAYRKIELRAPDGSYLYQREESAESTGVPGWFASWASLPQPVGRAEVVSGWDQVGTVAVTADPGTALRDLWRSLTVELAWVGIIALIALWLLWRGTVLFMRPLSALEAHSHALETGDFEARMPEPRSRELGRVARAVNHMTRDLGQTFERQVRLIDRLESRLRYDDVTWLENRQAFEQRLKTELHSEEGHVQGVLAILHLSDFQVFNQVHGRIRGNELLQACAEELRFFEAGHSGVMVGRGVGGEFLLFQAGLGNVDVEHNVRGLVDALTRHYARFNQPRPARIHCGLAAAGPALSLGELFARADTALRQAQDEEESALRWSGVISKEPTGASEWQVALDAALSGDRLLLEYQPVFDRKGSQCHQQVLSRLELDGEWLTAARFVPLLERYGRLSALDLVVLERVLGHLTTYPDESFVVPLGMASLADESFLVSMSEKLRSVERSRAKRLWLAFPERVVRFCPGAVDTLVALAHEQGARIMVDQFGAGGISFDYLRRWPLDALRVDRSYIRDLHQRPDARFFLESIIPVARGRGMEIFVSGVETADEWGAVQGLDVSGALGFHLRRPQSEPGAAG